MSAEPACPRCGAPVAPDEPTCPTCLLRLALDLPSAAQLPGGDEPGEDEGGLYPGQRVGPYTVVRLLGAGGMGAVHLAEQTDPVRREVALKVIRRGMDSRQVVARFAAEQQALARMDHPCIARVLDAGETADGRPYFVMEYVPGEPLTAHCDRRGLGLPARLDLFVQVCEGVQHAHQRGIIHRDLKPSNVLVTEAGGAPLPKIIDFGVAKAVEQRLTERTLFTELGVLVGTPEYMSPEQAEISPVDVDTRTDVYSLGVLLYELLTGELPFDPAELRAAGFDEICRRIREVEPPAPSVRLAGAGRRATDAARRRGADLPTLRRAITGEMDWITLRALEKERDRRYGSPAELAADIRRHLAHEPVSAGPPSAAYRLRKFIRRNRALVASLALIFVALALGAALATAFGLREAQERRRADAALRDLEEVAAFQAGMLGDVDPQAMGAGLLADLRQRGQEALEKAGLPADQAADEVVAFDAFTGRINATDAALRTLDIEVLDRAATAAGERFSTRPLLRARLLQTIGHTYLQLGLLSRAEPHLRRAVEIREAELGRRHPATAEALDRQATLLWKQGSLEAAEALFTEALGSRREALGPDHELTLESMNNLGILLTDQGRYSEAEAIHADLLAARRRVLGADHRSTLTSMNALAIVVENQGRLDEAGDLYLACMEGRRRTLGEEHVETITAMSNVANSLVRRGRLDEAAPLALKALDLRRRVMGNEHPETLRTSTVVARLLFEQGRLQESADLLTESLEIKRRVLGPDHQSTLISMNNLADTIAHQGRLEEAERLHRQALAARRRALGAEHPDTLASLSNLAKVVRLAGRLPEAERLYLDVLERRRRVLGPENLSTLLVMNNLGMLYAESDRLERAEPLLRETYETLRRVQGPDKPQTLAAMGNLAEIYTLGGDPGRAEPLLAEAAETARSTLSAGNRITASLLRKQGDCLAALGRLDQAEALLLQAHGLLAAATGEADKETRKAASALAELYEARGRADEAFRWRVRASPSPTPGP